MKEYYLFGAGINCFGVIRFLGKQSIMAVIDNDTRKQGKSIEGIPIISLQEYIERNDKRQIIITSFIEGDSIAKDLKTKGIYNYYKSPFMQNGFYENAEDIVDKLALEQYEKIVFCTRNPIANLIVEELCRRNKKIVITYLEKEEITKITSCIPVIITNEEDKKLWKKSKIDSEENVLDINEIFETKFGYTNEKIKTIKDIHKGKRCFIIGNGPSLKYEDLEKLQKHGDICFGVNRIYLSYPYTNWRPDYYVAVDYMIVKNDIEKILEMDGIRFIRHFYCLLKNWSDDEIFEFRGRSYEAGKPQISFDMYQGVYMGNTVIYDAIQIAFYMGFQKIYLLGVDMTSGIRAEDQGSHFYRMPKQGEVFGTSNMLEARRCLKYAAEILEKENRTLWNATRGGELDEVRRIDFDSLF